MAGQRDSCIAVRALSHCNWSQWLGRWSMEHDAAVGGSFCAYNGRSQNGVLLSLELDLRQDALIAQFCELAQFVGHRAASWHHAWNWVWRLVAGCNSPDRFQLSLLIFLAQPIFRLGLDLVLRHQDDDQADQWGKNCRKQEEAETTSTARRCQCTNTASQNQPNQENFHLVPSPLVHNSAARDCAFQGPRQIGLTAWVGRRDHAAFACGQCA